MVSRRTGIIVTAVIAVLFGCAGLTTCVGGLITAPFSTMPYEALGPWVWFAANMCSAAAFITLPVVFYILFVASSRPEAAPPAAEPPSQ